MANVKILGTALLTWEGGFVFDKDDHGGATMKGITLSTYTEYRRKKGLSLPTQQDLRAITEGEWWDILKTVFWDPWLADEIQSQAVANICVNWGWGAGVKTAIMAVQQLLGLQADGIVGSMTLGALNAKQAEYTFNLLKAGRGRQLLQASCVGNNKKYLNGWLRKWEGFTLHSIALNGEQEIRF